MSDHTFARPPYILAHPADTAGCGFYRVIKPIEALSKAGVIAGRIELGYIPEGILPNMAPDVVVFQRPSEPQHIEALKRYRREVPNAFLVYEIDDALGAVPEASYHFPFKSPTIDERIPVAAALCDVITVTTEALQKHMQELCPGKPVRVVPNMLTAEDLKKADAVPRSPDRSRFRVGWGGGMGHAGDLALLEGAMAELRNEVTWVFIGFKPENIPAGVDFEYRDAVPPPQYVEALAKLDVDVIVAPLEENHFNECKSNLRLIEAGACRFPVIATPFGPYLTKRPPVEYAEETDGWVYAIRRMMALSPAGRKQKADAMRIWVERNYLVDDHLAERVRAWLPDGAKPFMPRRSPGRGVDIARGTAVVGACFDNEYDVLYVRDGVTVSDEKLSRFIANERPANWSVVSVVTNDGGTAGFPAQHQFTPLPPEQETDLQALIGDIGGTAKMQTSYGPVILLSRAAMNWFGKPDFERWVHPELAIMEWSVACAARGFQPIADLGTFVRVEKPLQVHPTVVEPLTARISARWPLSENEEAKFAEFRETVELRFHRGAFRQLMPSNPSDYTAWSRLYDSPGPGVMEAALTWANSGPIPPVDVVLYGDDPLTAASLGDCSKGRWKLFLRRDCVPALMCMAHAFNAINTNPDATIFYGDHDLAPDGVRQDHDFKPNFDLHLLLGRDYVSQALLVRADLAASIPLGYSTSLPAPCQLYDLVLGEAGAALAKSERLPVHIPRIMAHLTPEFPALTEQYATVNRITAARLAETFGWNAIVQPYPGLTGYNKISYRAPAIKPKVSIIIPTKDNFEMIAPCLATILRMTTYPNFEVLVIDNGGDDEEVQDFFAMQTDPRFKHAGYRTSSFNWSALNNYAATIASGDILCFLNDDTRVLDPEWLTEMVGAASFPGVSAVGARLSYPNNTVQHIGVTVTYGNAGHIQHGLPSNYAGYNGIALLSHEATAVTGACLLVRRETFDAIGGFNEELANNFNDVAFCLEARRKGGVCVVPAGAHLMHIAGSTRRAIETPELSDQTRHEVGYMRARYTEPDPYWNPNLLFGVLPGGTVAVGTDMQTLQWPAPANPWDTDQFQRVLVIGDTSVVRAEIQDKEAIYRVLIQGNMAQIVDPPLANVRPFDLRDPDTAAKTVRELGIDKIVVSTLENGSTLMLSFVTRLGPPVIYRPKTAEPVCPMRTLRRDNEACGGGWKIPGECQRCVDTHGSPNGYVSTAAWQAEWKRFLEYPNVTVQLEYLENPVYGDAVSHAFGGAALENIPAA